MTILAGPLHRIPGGGAEKELLGTLLALIEAGRPLEAADAIRRFQATASTTPDLGPSSTTTPSEFSPETQRLKDAAMTTRVGPTIMLGSGTRYDFLAPEASALTIDDIAWGLAFTCRFAGQCVSRFTGERVFYSVAEHCVRMSEIVPAEHAYSALMHESEEAVCHDVTGPLKSICPDYKVISKACQAAAFEQFQVPMHDPDLIKRFDTMMWATEFRDLIQGGYIHETIPVLPIEIRPWTSQEAAERFLERFWILAPEEVRCALRSPPSP